MAGELRMIGAVLAQSAALRAGRAYRAHVRHDPVARLYTRAGIADPYPTYERLRAQPFVRHRLGFRITARYELCRAVLRSRDFGVRELNDPAPTGPTADATMDLAMLQRDPPDHTRLRRLVSPAFTPRAMQGHRALIERTADELLDRLDDRFDLVPSYASPLPVTVISGLLGLSSSDATTLARHGEALSSALDGIRSPMHLRAVIRAAGALEPAFGRLIEQRRREPADDLLSTLVAASAEDRLTEYELYVTCNLLLIAGFETTVNLIGNAVAILLDRPDLWEELRADPDLAGPLAEEVLRYDPPVQSTFRVARRQVEIGGVTFRPGAGVMLLLGGAARDPEAYPDPDRFDPHRAHADHLAFSAGIHYCVGAPLARLEAEVALRRLAARFPRLRAAGRPHYRPATTIRGYSSLPLRAA